MKRFIKWLFLGIIVVVAIVVISGGDEGTAPPEPSPPPTPPVVGGDPWAAVRAADVAEIEAGWGAPARLAVSDGGWEDSLFVTPDGERIYFAYYPGDLIGDVAKGKFTDDLDVYYSDSPFTGKKKDTRFHLSEDTWSEVGPMIAADGGYFYNSNRDYLNDQKSDTDIYRNNERLALNDDREFGNPHYCAARDELWFDEKDARLWVLKGANAGNWGGAPEHAPAPLQVGSASNFQPWLSENCGTIYFTSNRGDVPSQGPAIYRATRQGETWGAPVPVVWSRLGVGEATLTADGKKLFFIQAFKNAEGTHTTDAFVVERP